MSSAVRRVALPSGGWWEIVTRPLWRHVSIWEHESRGLAERALVSLTTAWSFDEEVSSETLSLRHEQDLIAVLETLQRELLPLLASGNPEQAAEELFAGLVEDRIPREFAEAHLMAATGWSWQTLQDTPADVVHRMAIYLAVTGARQTQTSMDFDHGRRGT